MSNFNYTEYLRNNPLLKPEVKDSLITESKTINEGIPQESEIADYVAAMYDSSVEEREGFQSDIWTKEEYASTAYDEGSVFIDLANHLESVGGKDVLEGNPDIHLELLSNGDIKWSADVTFTESVEEVQETSSKMKVSELKAKIKEDIMSLLQEEDNSSKLEDELMADLDEEITEAEEDEDVEVEIEDEVEDDIEDEVGGGDAEALDPEAGLSQDEQDIQNALKVAYDNAVELGDEKLSKQIGNTITMFTRTRVVGDLN